jgi:hypothetical protein
MSDDSMSGSDLDAGETGEGACIRVVQSSLHASIMQASLFKVPEKSKEFEEEKDQKSAEANSAIQENAEIIQLIEALDKKRNSESNDEAQQSKIESFSKSSRKSSLKSSKDLMKKVKKLTSQHLKEVFDEKEVKKGKVDVEKRFYEFKRKVNLKIETLKEEKQAKESEICTFHPKTSSIQTEKLSFPHFLKHMELVNENHKKNLEKIQNEKQAEEKLAKTKLFKPTLSKMTQKIAKKHKSTSNLHEKLFKESEELKLKKAKESEELLKQTCPFKPVLLNQNYIELKKSEKPRENLLIQENIQRKSEKLISENSETIIREKFLKELEEVLPNEDLDINSFLHVLETTRFIHQEEIDRSTEEIDLVKKAWKHLSGAQNIASPSKVKEFLLVIQNLSHPNDSKLFFEYKLLTDNRKLSKDFPKQKISLNFSFKPEINPVSLDLAKTVRGKRMNSYSTARPEKVLLIIQKEADKKVEEQRKKAENDAFLKCSFRPKTSRGPCLEDEFWSESNSLACDYFKILNEKQHRCEILFDFSKVEQERKEKGRRTADDFEIERNMGECTFTPDIHKKLKEGASTERTRQKIRILPKQKGKKVVHQRSNFNELLNFTDSDEGSLN